MNSNASNAYDFDFILRKVEEDVKTLACLEKEIVDNLHSSVYIQCSRNPVAEHRGNKNLISNLKFKQSNLFNSVFTLPFEMEMSSMSGQVVNLASQIAGNYYCPFCPLRHMCELGLKIHLKQIHKIELDLLWKKKVEHFHFQGCPCCGAKFYLKGVCLKHFVTYHSELVLNSWNLLTCGNQNSLCNFCKQDFHGLKTDVFIMHFLNKHSEEFENILFLSAKISNHENGIPVTGSPESISPPKNISPLKRNSNKSVKRALQFSVPEAVVHLYQKTSTDECEAELSESTRAHTNDENDIDDISSLLDDFFLKSSPIPKKKKKKKKLFRKSKKSPPKPKYTSTPLKRRCALKQNLWMKLHLLFHGHFSPSSPNKLYRCGSCQSRFHHNRQLVCHVRRHFRFRMLPIFCCGLCPAQFYENRFLLLHSAEQHPNCFAPL